MPVARLLLLFVLLAPMGLAAQSQYYTLLSKCSILLTRSGDSATVEMDGRKYKARILRDAHSPEYVQVLHRNRMLFRASFTPEEAFILNDRYQQGCEAAKLILLHDPADSSAGADFRKYLQNTPYIMDDTAAILAKSGYMLAKHWNAFSAVLLEALIAAHPDVIDAYRRLGDSYRGMPNASARAETAWQEYQSRLRKRNEASTLPARRP